ncbi:TRAP transporter small permease subunit [Acuticoccus sp. M5D2P5]|uniref:TRAP transporter small permease n=1 Tax=Acuticoccus kalidii TaxID=2910977 RepID=UPI001F3FECF7|nr:TRAP transporter small permease subunit [Acuticoccus kalidii]MCF3935259.1 TRAP transporter small permease subunit [Acuticoccus kalidii]
MTRIASAVATVLGAVVVALFTTLMALTLLQVLNRYLIGAQLFWTEEVIRLLLVWVVLLATPVALYRRQEIKVDLLRLPPAMERVKIILAVAASVVFCAILARTGYAFTMRAVNGMSITLGISRAWFYLPLPLGAALSVLALLVRPAEDPASEANAARLDTL